MKEEYEKIKTVSKNDTHTDDFYVIYPKISLIHITNSEMDKKKRNCHGNFSLKKIKNLPYSAQIVGRLMLLAFKLLRFCDGYRLSI